MGFSRSMLTIDEVRMAVRGHIPPDWVERLPWPEYERTVIEYNRVIEKMEGGGDAS